MAEAPVPITMQEVIDATTWEEAQDIANRGITEIRDIKAGFDDLVDTAREARDALQAAQDRRAELQQIMQALIAKGPDFE